MNNFRLYSQDHNGYSLVSNNFIDTYMREANGDFVKIYFYLVRMLGCHKQICVDDIADFFNLTESDVLRAIKYWIDKGVLCPAFDGNGELSGMVFADLNNQTDTESLPDYPVNSKAPKKPHFTSMDLERLCDDSDWENLLFVTKTMFHKDLSSLDIQTLLYIYQTLGFSYDLCEYLVEYCVSNGKYSHRYLEATAVNWFQDGVDTRELAKAMYGNMNKTARIVYRTLGFQKPAPSKAELEMFKKWTENYAFSNEIIELACDRCVKHADNPSIKYIDSVLSNWNKAGVHSVEDIDKLDKKREAETTWTSDKNTKNQFHNFSQKILDKELAEMELLLQMDVNKK